MKSPHHSPSSMMTELFRKMPLNSDFFVIRRLAMQGRKIDVPYELVRSKIHCFFFVTSGEVLITIGEGSYYFKTNECAIIPAGQAFSVRYFDDCTGYMGGFNEEFLNSNNNGQNIIQAFGILRCWGAHKASFDKEYGKYIEDIFERLYHENIGRKNKNIIRAYLVTLLTEMEEALVLKQKEEAILKIENEVCNKFIELVFKYCSHSRPISDYTEKLGVSKDYLHKTVKQSTGKTPHEWIVEAVILEAKVLLNHTDKLVNEIALAVGIEDPSYFSRLFKKKTGQTPAEYRKGKKSYN